MTKPQLMQNYPQNLVQKIEECFEQLEVLQDQYLTSGAFEDWVQCIQILPQIADLVTCLEIEKQQLEGKHPIN